VEAGAVIGWDRYAGPEGTIIGMHSFGGSAPATGLMRKFGFVADGVLQAAKDQIAKHQIAESAGKHPQ
jgi:transketolase